MPKRMIVVLLAATAALARAGGPDPGRSGDAGSQAAPRAERPRSRSPAPGGSSAGLATDARRESAASSPSRRSDSPSRTATGGDGAAPETEAAQSAGPGADAGATAASAEKSAKALDRAKTEAGKLKATFDDPGPLGGGGPPGGRREAATAPASEGLDPIAAYAAGYAPVYQELGLRVGRGPDGRLAVLDAAGKAAGPDALAALRARLDAAPRALMRRPDFFEVIDRARYEELKTRRARAEPAPGAAFRDIGLTERRRDLVWTASCSRVSGDCNAAAVEAAYKKGDDVSPETLLSVWKKIKAANGGVWGARAPDRAEAPAAALGRNAGLLDRVRRALASFGADAAGPEPRAAAPGPEEPAGWPVPDEAGGPQARAAPRPRASAASATAPPAAPGAGADHPPAPWPRIALAAAGLGLVALAGLCLRRSR